MTLTNCKLPQPISSFTALIILGHLFVHMSYLHSKIVNPWKSKEREGLSPLFIFVCPTVSRELIHCLQHAVFWVIPYGMVSPLGLPSTLKGKEG